MTVRTKIATRILAGLCAGPAGGALRDDQLIDKAIQLTEDLVERLRETAWDHGRAPQGDLDDGV